MESRIPLSELTIIISTESIVSHASVPACDSGVSNNGVECLESGLPCVARAARHRISGFSVKWDRSRCKSQE